MEAVGRILLFEAMDVPCASSWGWASGWILCDMTERL